MSKLDDVWTLRNVTTGEVGIFDPATVRVSRPGRRRHPYYQPGRFAWYTVSSDDYAAAIRHLKGSPLHVFTALPLLMGKDNQLRMKQKDIVEATGLSVGAVSDGMKVMRQQLLIGELQGVLRFSPDIAWKGYAQDLEPTRRLWWDAKKAWIAERKKRLKGELPE